MSDATNAPVSSATAERCAFCEHLNPPSAKYCNECAADLHLTLCEKCSAINRRGLSHCHRCGVALAQPELRDEQAPSAPPSETSPPHPQRRSWAIPLALLAIVAVAVVFLATRMTSLPALDLRSLASALRLDADSAERSDVAPPEPAPRQPTPPAPPPEPAPRHDTPPAAPPESAPRQPTPPAAMPAPANRDTARACTDAAAALSLCKRNASNEQK